ncbi:MAG: hypothetical protein ISN28_09925 [Ectothiorhodospiraceae bacterium AqS1]|nr:hypothetical protein [Ectothiorhodospiraceae bacterium AqS1]
MIGVDGKNFDRGPALVQFKLDDASPFEVEGFQGRDTGGDVGRVQRAFDPNRVGKASFVREMAADLDHPSVLHRRQPRHHPTLDRMPDERTRRVQRQLQPLTPEMGMDMEQIHIDRIDRIEQYQVEDRGRLAAMERLVEIAEQRAAEERAANRSERKWMISIYIGLLLIHVTALGITAGMILGAIAKM